MEVTNALSNPPKEASKCSSPAPCGGVRLQAPCFYPLCTNTTNWFYNGLITIGVEKASQWTNNFGSLDMQMMPMAHDRCIPVAYTSVFVCSPTSIHPPNNPPQTS